ncbi:MAG: hypothetical protein LBG05_09775 [Treponema sp.]|jgi:hypothetical protein|nr:hypothetical protein [Treponema sp.]
MLSREDFVWTIGYDGPVAVIDKQAKQKYGHLSTRELAEKGFFRAAYSSAIHSKNVDELQAMVDVYNKTAVAPLTASSPLDRLFGVFPVEVKRTVEL